MKVLVVGPGRFGLTIAKEFADFGGPYRDVAIVGLERKTPERKLDQVRWSAEYQRETPDVIVFAFSAVPVTVRQELVDRSAEIEEFWDVERRYNLAHIRSFIPWIERSSAKLVVVATNPVHEWVNALLKLFPRRKIVGLGTAFDERRIRYLAAAMSPGREQEVIALLRIFGGHGDSFAISCGQVSADVLEVARWVSNAISVAFVAAPEGYAELWWSQVAISPLVEGLAGREIRTHLVVPINLEDVEAATGVDTIVRALDFREVLPEALSREETQMLVSHLQEMRRTGEELAEQLR